MRRFARVLASWLLPWTLCAPAMSAQTTAPGKVPQVAIRGVRVLGTNGAVEIEVETSDRVVPQTQILTGPDRLVVDLPNAVPGPKVRSQSVYRGEVKDVRVGLFQSNPPVTRVVLDLNSAQPYQIFPYGRTVMIKVMSPPEDDSVEADASSNGTSGAGLVVANYTSGAQLVQSNTPAKAPLEVLFRQGMLSIKSNKATLSEVLYAVQQRTGADIAIVAGAEQEKVVADLGPAPAPEVLGRLLNGSKFNFLIVSAENDPQKLERVILSPRNESAVVPLAPLPTSDADDDDSPPAPTPPPPINQAPQPAKVQPAPNGPQPPGSMPPGQLPETKPEEEPQQ
jgi:AMIN domain-containing protein